jgi:protein-S-isoprenylcysteine O-methyltransferase Ste14
MDDPVISNLGRRAAKGMLGFLIALAVLVFLPAGTLRYWQGWLFLAVFTLCMAGVTLYLLKHDPALVEQRMKAGPTAEREPRQKRIQAMASLCLCGIAIVSALDHRFGWSPVPAWLVVAGDVLIIVGYLLVLRVFRENSFASTIIEIGAGQRVIATGPYALVRHPMYAGALVLLAGVPLALGSIWGLLTIPPMLGILILRLQDEEGFLVRNLVGYEDYRRKVRWRLVPGLW